MENASKALIMAGSILIAILIISLGILIFNNFRDKAISSANLDKQEISEFNSKITPYVGQNTSGSQVNTLIQYVISNNIAVVNSGETFKGITIKYPTTSGNVTIKLKDDGTAVEYNPANSPKRVETGAGKYYIVDAEYGDNGLINSITVTAR